MQVKIDFKNGNRTFFNADCYDPNDLRRDLNHLTITKFKQNNWHSSDGAEIYYDFFNCGSHFKERSI